VALNQAWKYLYSVVVLIQAPYSIVLIKEKKIFILWRLNKLRKTFTADPSGQGRGGIMGSNPTGGMDVCLVQCLCCQVEVSETGPFLFQSSPTDCGVCLSVIK
jgi:hypothetical protein